MINEDFLHLCSFTNIKYHKTFQIQTSAKISTAKTFKFWFYLQIFVPRKSVPQKVMSH